MPRIKRIADKLKSYICANRLLFICLWITSAWSVIDVPFSALYGFPTAFSIAYVVSVGAFKAVLLCSICMLVSRSHVIVKVLWRVMLFLYVALSLTNCLSFVLYGFGISRRLFIIIAQTNPIELREFMPDLADNIMAMCRNVGLWIAVALAAGALAVTVRHTKAKTFITLAGVMSTIGAVALAWLMLTFKYGRLSNFMCLRAPQYLNETLQTKRAYDLLADRLLPFPDPDLVESERLPVNIVMVIGESASRNHHSLYGYELPTTPRLDSIREQLTIFTDAIGSSCGTVGNMERILTFKDDDLTCNDWYKFPGIIDLFKNAGYKTYYLSNQEKMGLTCDAFGAMAATADVVTYAGVLVREDALSYKHDDVLLPEIRKALNDSTAGYRFIIAHLLGSHTQYSMRFPETFAKFSAADELAFRNHHPWLNKAKAQKIADYDNSIAFTDSILRNLIDSIGAIEAPTVFLYFSDHGEHVYDTKDFIGREAKYVEIPLFFYLNKAYRNLYPNMCRRLNKARNLPVSSANIIYPLMTVSGTSYPRYNAENDFLSPRFKVRRRNVDEQPWAYDHCQ